MKRKGKIILTIVLLLVVVAAGLLFWQRNNIKALQYLATMDQGELEKRGEQNEQVFQDMLDEYEINPPTFTPEELETLTKGGADMNQAAKDLLNGQIGQPNPDVEQPTTTKPIDPPKPNSDGSDPKTDQSEAIRTQVAKMYVLKATFVSRLQAVVSSAKSDFAALPAEQRTDAGKKSIIQTKIGQLGALESQCDGEVAAVVSELRRLLKESGQSTALADQVQAAYAEEKSVQKAYYIKQMNG